MATAKKRSKLALARTLRRECRTVAVTPPGEASPLTWYYLIPQEIVAEIVAVLESRVPA